MINGASRYEPVHDDEIVVAQLRDERLKNELDAEASLEVLRPTAAAPFVWPAVAPTLMPNGTRSDDRPRLVSAIGACDGWSAGVVCQPDTSIWNTAR